MIALEISFYSNGTLGFIWKPSDVYASTDKNIRIEKPERYHIYNLWVDMNDGKNFVQNMDRARYIRDVYNKEVMTMTHPRTGKPIAFRINFDTNEAKNAPSSVRGVYSRIEGKYMSEPPSSIDSAKMNLGTGSSELDLRARVRSFLQTYAGAR